MNILLQDAPCVNLNLSTVNPLPYEPLNGATVVEWFKVYDKIAKQWRNRAAGYNIRLACSDRTRGGQFHADKGFNIACDLVEELKAKNYLTFLIRIRWKRSGRLIHYSILVNTIEKCGELVDMHDGLQWHLPLCHWSIDGAAPVGPAVVAEEVPQVEQPMLFDFAEPVKRYGGAY